jgi:alpha-beta hydrolase superfamily lysophospholipase
MKLKLVQKVAIYYYATKIKIIFLISKTTAVKQAFDLFCTPYSGKVIRIAPPVFQSAKTLMIIQDKLKIKGWQWNPEKSNHKKILILHGFDSCSYKFEKFIVPLTNLGFTVFAFDAPAHGISEGKTVNALQLKNTILTINKTYGNLYAIIGHSFGGFAAALAIESLANIQKLVLIAPPVETIKLINSFFSVVPLGEKIKSSLIDHLESMSKQKITYYSTARALIENEVKTIWLHDEEDNICVFEDVAKIQNLALNHVEFYITKGLGHNKIYRDLEVKEKIFEFLVS